MKIRNFALFILIKTSLIVSNEYQNTLCHKKLKVMIKHFIKNIGYSYYDVNCYKMIVTKIISENTMNQIQKDLPYIHCIMPSLPALQSAKREYQSSIKFGYLQGCVHSKLCHPSCIVWLTLPIKSVLLPIYHQYFTLMTYGKICTGWVE